MAIYHLSMKPISRASGRSAVASAAYRSAERLTNERDGLTHDFTRRGGVEHAEIVIPTGVSADWARNRSALWNAAEQAENRKDARVAREFEIALPHELNAEQRLEATRDFAQGLANRYGTAVDFAIHAPHGPSPDQVRGDVRNHHAHLMMTVRAVGPEGLGDKTSIERENKWLLSNDLPTSQMQLRDIRQSWEQVANQKLAEAGFDLRIDHRSHQERGLEIEPTEHMGVYATQMQRRGLDVSRVRLDAEAARRNAALIREKPEQVLSLITGEKSVLDRHDVAKALHRAINDPQEFQAAFAKAMASTALVTLAPETSDAHGEVALARYSTREMVDIERGMADGAMRMGEGRRHGVDRGHVEAALATQTQAIRQGAAAHAGSQVERGELSEAEGQLQVRAAGLSDEQTRAVEHITGPEQLAAVVGFAGAGKSTMLAAARQAWEAEGYSVHGAALSGKAAEGLQESSGIASRTLASWDYGWQAGRGELGSKDVLVIDEAGMVGSRQLARFVLEAEVKGAKLVLVGDHEQLQAIGAGAPFRAIAERVGFASLQDIRRQREGWQRGASSDFARHRTAEGLASYAERGAVTFSDTRDEVRGAIVRDYMHDIEQRPEGSRVAMAHRRIDVRALNDDIRAARQERGDLARGAQSLGTQSLGTQSLGADAGERVYETSNGPRAFAAGDRIVFLENNRDLGVKNGMLGTVAKVEEGRIVAQLDGPSTGSGGRDGAARVVSVSLHHYAAIDHGYATTIHKTQGATVDRSFVMASGTMDRHLTYVAMTRHRDGAQLYAAREEFKGRGAEPSPMEARHFETLAARLGRDGSKETTLDYAKEFSERRGIAETLGVGSEIEVSRQVEPGREKPERERETVAPAAQEPAKKRGMFAGLKLDSGPTPSKSREARDAFAGLKLSASERPASAKESERDQLLSATEGYARAFSDAARMGGLGLPIVEHQKQALEKAGAALDAIRAASRRELQSAMRHDPQTLRAMHELRGPERAARLVAGMERERQAQLDPNVRAARLVTQWNGLEQERSQLRGWDQREAREKVEAQMRSVAVEIGKDKPVESALRAKPKDFGIEDSSGLGRALREKDLGQALEQRVTQGQRERGHQQSM